MVTPVKKMPPTKFARLPWACILRLINIMATTPARMLNR
jgi:hypothetical protein